VTHRISAVIGAHYGDEGKGRCVDLLVQRLPKNLGHKPLVVRYNSSGQAGHSVVRGPVRHVFKHHGSGTLAGASTVLCHKFIVNPIIFNQERAELIAHDHRFNRSVVYIDERCIVATPLDALLNQLNEFSRGEGRHGSCGVGFGETIERHQRAPALTVRVSHDTSTSDFSKIERYALEAIERRNIDVSKAPHYLQNVVEALRNGTFNWGPWRHHLRELKLVAVIVNAAELRALLRTHEVVFEGAQGLLLHQDHPNFPHVTRSRTGVEDVYELLDELQIHDRPVDTYYCSRTYLTRHGAGPLPFEATAELMTNLGFKIEDPTNVTNDFQGSLRYSPLINSFNHCASDVLAAIQQHRLVKTGELNVVISCADQAPDEDHVKRVVSRAAIVAHRVWVGSDPRSAVTELRYRRADMGTPATEEVVEAQEPAAPADAETAKPEGEVTGAEASAEA
jgi:adenylosuccinate synthase